MIHLQDLQIGTTYRINSLNITAPYKGRTNKKVALRGPSGRIVEDYGYVFGDHTVSAHLAQQALPAAAGRK